MRATLQFVGLMALGMIIAVAWQGVFFAAGKSKPSLDLVSYAAGLSGGLLLAAITRVDWVLLPRRLIGWLVGNVRNLQLGCVAAICIAVIVFY